MLLWFLTLLALVQSKGLPVKRFKNNFQSYTVDITTVLIRCGYGF